MGLSRWLDGTLKTEFKAQGAAVPIGKQTDGDSCGICVLNAMDHAMVGTELFNQRAGHLVRMDLFTRTMRHLLEKVSLPLLVSSQICS